MLERKPGFDLDRLSRGMKVGLFTDTLDDINGVARFVRDMGEEARRRQLHFVVHTCTGSPRFDLPFRRNFSPMLKGRLPLYPELEMNLPPVAEILDWVNQQKFDAIHISTPGAMGLSGWLAGRYAGIPLLGTYHTDFPAYVQRLSDSRLLLRGTVFYTRRFYRAMNTVFSRSCEYRQSLVRLGIDQQRLTTILPCINTDKFNVHHRDLSLFNRLGVKQPRRILYCGRVSREKNLALLVEAVKQLFTQRTDTALVVAGDGPYMNSMQAALQGFPVYFLGYQNDQQLGLLYASSDLFVFPSRTDTLGQVVMEAQSSGLPVIVSDEGGPREICADGVSGIVVKGENPQAWCQAIASLLDDEPLRRAMSQAAPGRISRFSINRTFEAFWAEHARAVWPAGSQDAGEIKSF
ncbi:MAG: glycosyltransferase [Phycisphaerales bacterium]|nr:glycosyltransferase [Phycisphaerales bacterium]